MRLLLLIFCVTSAVSAQKLTYTMLQSYFRHAGMQKLVNLVSNLNSKDTTAAQQKTRIKNWAANNFGTVSSKTYSLLDNKTWVVKKVQGFIDHRFALKNYVQNGLKNKLKSLYNGALADKIIAALWMVDKWKDGTDFTGEVWSDMSFVAKNVMNDDQRSKWDTAYYDIQDAYSSNSNYKTVFEFKLQDDDFVNDQNARFTAT